MRVCSVEPKRLATCTLSAPVAHSSMRRARKTIRFSRCQLSAYVVIPAAGACTAATPFFEESIYFFRRTSKSAAVRSELKPSGGINETAAQDRERKRLCGPAEGFATGFFMTLGSRSSSQPGGRKRTRLKRPARNVTPIHRSHTAVMRALTTDFTCSPSLHPTRKQLLTSLSGD